MKLLQFFKNLFRRRKAVKKEAGLTTDYLTSIALKDEHGKLYYLKIASQNGRRTHLTFDDAIAFAANFSLPDEKDLIWKIPNLAEAELIYREHKSNSLLSVPDEPTKLSDDYIWTLPKDFDIWFKYRTTDMISLKDGSVTKVNTHFKLAVLLVKRQYI